MKLSQAMRDVIVSYTATNDSQIEKMERYVSGLMLPLTQARFDVLVSLGLSIGTTNLGRATLVRVACDMQADAQQEFLKWAEKTGEYARRLTESLRWRGQVPTQFTDDGREVTNWRSQRKRR